MYVTLTSYPPCNEWDRQIRILTANGPVLRYVVFPYLRWLTSPPLHNDCILVEACISPEVSFDPDATRLSGMYVYQTVPVYDMAVALNGSGILHTAGMEKQGYFTHTCQ